MRIFKFIKIDVFLCRSYLWILLFPALVFVIILVEPDMNPLFASLYCLFGGLIISSLPFSLSPSLRTESFTHLLPARRGDDVRGHFLFSFLFLLLFLLLSAVTIAVSAVIRPSMGLQAPAAYPVLFAVALIFAAAQNLLFCFFHPGNMQVQQLMRIIPPFLFFFGGTALLENIPSAMALLEALLTPMGSAVCLLSGLLVFLLAAQIGAMLSAGRDH